MISATDYIASQHGIFLNPYAFQALTELVNICEWTVGSMTIQTLDRACAKCVHQLLFHEHAQAAKR